MLMTSGSAKILILAAALLSAAQAGPAVFAAISSC